MNWRQRIKEAPEDPGVYFFKDAGGQILYVGKAKSLRKRLASYARAPRPAGYASRGGRSSDPKTQVLVQRAAEVDWEVASSEVEALLMESAYVKRFNPRFNIDLKDDKSYPYLEVTVGETFPRFLITRGRDRKDSVNFGPFTDARLLHLAVKWLRQIFPLRSCNTLPKRPCLDYFIKQCIGPCRTEFNQHEEYRHLVRELILFLRGKRRHLADGLRRQMEASARREEFEQAARLRDRLVALGHITSFSPQRLDRISALADLQKILKLKRLPRRIEGYDVSNLFGKQATASRVTFVEGVPYKHDYRQYKIQSVQGIDDYEMMREVIRRSFEHVAARERPAPDLILIDGGRGHLQAALGVLVQMGLSHLPILGLAKENEDIYLPAHDRPLILSRRSPALQLLQRVRDEAHRFAIRYHRRLRGAGVTVSVLDQIAGMGPKQKRALLKGLGSVLVIQRASVEDLLKVPRVTPRTARAVYEFFHISEQR